MLPTTTTTTDETVKCRKQKQHHWTTRLMGGEMRRWPSPGHRYERHGKEYADNDNVTSRAPRFLTGNVITDDVMGVTPAHLTIFDRNVVILLPQFYLFFRNYSYFVLPSPAFPNQHESKLVCYVC